MKKILIFITLVLMLALIFLFFPRTAENAIVLSNDSTSISVLIGGNTKVYKTQSNYPKLTVVTFNYNLFRAYNFKVIIPLKDRIMIKNDDYYDLETMGKTSLSPKAYFYKVDKNNNLTLCSSKNIVVGKNNVISYKNKKGFLTTFLITDIDYSFMRVGISTTGFTSVFHDKVQLKLGAAAKVYSKMDSIALELPKNTELTLENEKNTMKLSVNKTNITLKNRLYITGENIEISSIIRGSAPFNPSYGGTLEVNISDNGLTVINEVNLEDYLEKVVPSEMPSTGGIESLKCQAIAARTYAISDMLSSRFSNLGFYVDDSTRSQVYNNISMQPLATEAVAVTKGMIMTYDGLPIDAKYYSTSSGIGESYSNVWFKADGSSDNKPYLSASSYLKSKISIPKTEAEWLNFYKNTNISAIDSDYPYFRWRIEYSKAGITTMLNKTLKDLSEGNISSSYITAYEGTKQTQNIPQLKDLSDIKILKRGNGGIAMEVSFIFSNATVTVKGDSYIRGAIKCSENYTKEKTAVILLKGAPQTNLGSMPSSFFSAEKVNDKFILYGGGFGHGSGMSQYGAIELSKQGLKYTDILNVYYKNIKIGKLY